MNNNKMYYAVVLVLLFLISCFGWYFYNTSFGKSYWNSCLLFLNNSSLKIIDSDRPKWHGSLSAKSAINGLCIEGDYRRKFFPPWVSIFYFHIPQTVVKEDSLGFLVSNSTVHDFTIFLEKRVNDEWYRLPIEISEQKVDVDTCIKRAFELKKNKASEETTVEPDLVIFGKVITSSIVTTYTLDTVWDFDYHFVEYNHHINIPINNLEYGRYRIKSELADIDTLWNEFDLVPKRNVKWQLNDSLFYEGNYLQIGILNNSTDDFYYMGDQKNALIGISATIKQDNNKDSSFSVLDNFTDIPVEWCRFPDGKKIFLKTLNPFNYISLKNGKTWKHMFYREDPNIFMKEFRKLYGKEFYISFSMRTRSFRFSKYKDQILESEKFKLRTEDVLASLKLGGP